MTIFVDTNILVRAAQPGHLQQPAALAAADALRRRNERLCIFPQVIYELWAVCTRPVGENGLGMTVQEALAELDKAERLFTLLPELPAVFHEWRRLIAEHNIKGKNAHDARLVAAMRAHSVTRILTFNHQDFLRFPDITVLKPEEVATNTGATEGS